MLGSLGYLLTALSELTIANIVTSAFVLPTFYTLLYNIA